MAMATDKVLFHFFAINLPFRPVFVLFRDMSLKTLTLEARRGYGSRITFRKAFFFFSLKAFKCAEAAIVDTDFQSEHVA